MIQGKKRTEAEYRKLPEDSSSSLKEFAQNRKKYYKRYILGEKVEDEEDTKATIIGRVVETLLLEKDKFDEKFHLSTVLNAPTGNMALFVEALYKHNKSGLFKEFEDCLKEAYKDSGYKLPFETILKKFNGSDAEIYFKEITEIRSKGLTVVTLQDVQNAEKIVEELKNNEFTREIFELLENSNPDIEIHVQVPIENYEIDELPLKSLFDIFIINHKTKSIKVYDLKCVWSVEGFTYDYYLYRLAYIQAYLYYNAALDFKSKNEKYQYYHVDFPGFIVCDSINYFSPLIYELSSDDIQDAYVGFERNGRKYKGVKEIIEELKWAKEYNIWNISKKNYEKQGKTSLWS